MKIAILGTRGIPNLYGGFEGYLSKMRQISYSFLDNTGFTDYSDDNKI